MDVFIPVYGYTEVTGKGHDHTLFCGKGIQEIQMKEPVKISAARDQDLHIEARMSSADVNAIEYKINRVQAHLSIFEVV